MIREGEVLYLGDLRILKKSLACFQVRVGLINSGAIYSRAKALNFWWVYELYVYVRSFVAMAAKRISKIILIHTYMTAVPLYWFFLGPICCICISPYRCQPISIKNLIDFQWICVYLWKTPSNGSTKQFTRTLYIIYFFKKPRTSIFLSVFVVVRVTPCLLCKYKSYIAFSSLSLNSKTFTEWLSVTVNDTVQCLVNPGLVY